jgi:acyl-CoA reductase-like NAD-dependent aldehyde dehydrogenase
MIAEHTNKTEYATESGREDSMNFESRNPAAGELLGVHPEHDKAETDARLQYHRPASETGDTFWRVSVPMITARLRALAQVLVAERF